MNKENKNELRQIFNKHGLTYSQIVGEETTVVSMGLTEFNQALKEIEQEITRAVSAATESAAEMARIDLLNRLEKTLKFTGKTIKVHTLEMFIFAERKDLSEKEGKL